MPPYDPDPEDDRPDPVAEAVDLLESFECTEYEAKCFVALTRIEQGTAKAVSEVADVPQARVYDCMEALQRRGLVDVRGSTPRKYRAATPGEAVRTLEGRVKARLKRLETLLPRLEAPEESDEKGVWITDSDGGVIERVQRLIEAADEEVLMAVAVEDLLTEEIVDALREAIASGVAVTVGSPSESIRARLSAALDDAAVMETWTWWDTHPIDAGDLSSVLLVDGEALLASTDGEPSPDGASRHAVWTDREETPLVRLLQPLLEAAIVGQGEGPGSGRSTP
ncbi:MAG: sugar-specific transcriptional regulator TrmB [Halobacteriales archaeon]|jgi:sugar-specific transcriptional regulator TrmB